jgi:hypothetical protein
MCRYTENFMADIAVQCMDMWDDLEKDAGTALRLMSGLLNFGDKGLGQGTPEGTLSLPWNFQVHSHHLQARSSDPSQISRGTI